MERHIKPPFRNLLFLLAILFTFAACSPYHKNGAQCTAIPIKINRNWDQQKLDEAFAFACHMGTDTLLLVSDGAIIKSMGDVDKPLRVHSVRKALLSAIVGQHLGTGPGKINLASTLAELDISDKPTPLTPLQQQATVLHLIKSISGINHPAAGEAGLMEKDKHRRLGCKPNPPGTIWAYNNWDYNALTRIFEQETGRTIYEAFHEGIAVPLDMQDFTEKSVWYEFETKLSMHPKAGFVMSARDLAKFGILYANRGQWKGQQIIPADWIDRVTEDYVVTGEKLLRSGHGYLWWVPIDKPSREIGIPEGTFVATGFGSQRIVVIPKWQTVIIHQVNAIDPIIAVMKAKGYSFKQAIRNVYMCQLPLFSKRQFCENSGHVANFLDSGFVKILSRLLDARIPE